MKIAVLDDSRVFLSYIKKQLAKLGYENIYVFDNPSSFYGFLKKDKNTDVVFIDYHLKETDGLEVLKKILPLPCTYKIMITSDNDPNLKEKALEIGFDNFFKKDISLVDLKALLNMVGTIRSFMKKESRKKEELKKLLAYKEKQEKIIYQKQNKIMQNELEMFFDENFMIETFFSPKDLLTGDTIHTKKLSENEYFVGVIDAMGKGLGASLTSFNAISFLKHSVKKAIEYNDFNFEKLVKDFVYYIKTILLDNEILCATLVYIQNGTVYYANFGNPPVLSEKNTLKTNNFPITVNSEDTVIDTVRFQNRLLISSDGIFESPYKNTIYYKRIKSVFPDMTFLKELVEDFYENSRQTDDMCLVYITKEKNGYGLLFEDTLELTKHAIDSFLKKLISQNIPLIEQIHLILHEILTNTYEYGILKIKDKDDKNHKKNNIKNDENVKFFAKIKISKNEKWLKIEYKDTTSGFNVQTIKDAFYKKYHGRGIKIIKHLSYGLFFNENGTAIKIFLKG
jgi:CheY-like chemotaxis protein